MYETTVESFHYNYELDKFHGSHGASSVYFRINGIDPDKKSPCVDEPKDDNLANTSLKLKHVKWVKRDGISGVFRRTPEVGDEFEIQGNSTSYNYTFVVPYGHMMMEGTTP